MQKAQPLVVIVGETASGKSALAFELAQRLDGELVCADSWTVYRGFDIGTAKPPAEERATVRHHLLDAADPEQGFSAAEFQRLAQSAVDAIRARGKLPIVVGGTGLYIDSILFNYQFLPKPAAGLRQTLSDLSLEQLRQKAHDDGLDTTGIDLNNRRRIIRLIESNGQRAGRDEMRRDALVIGVQVDREHLRQRIEQRVDSMLATGLEGEVWHLAERYGWQAEPMKGIGYREWYPYFHPEPGSKQDLAQTRERIISATMGLAKRQRTWFKRNQRIHWLSQAHKIAESVDLITSFGSK